jgi:hypothetical protein
VQLSVATAKGIEILWGGGGETLVNFIFAHFALNLFTSYFAFVT